MDIIIAIIVGGIIGWIASMIMGTNSQQGILANIIVGIIGSFLGKYVFADVLGIGGATTAGTFSLSGLFWGIVGAIGLILILKLLNVFK